MEMGRFVFLFSCAKIMLLVENRKLDIAFDGCDLVRYKFGFYLFHGTPTWFSSMKQPKGLSNFAYGTTDCQVVN